MCSIAMCFVYLYNFNSINFSKVAVAIEKDKIINIQIPYLTLNAAVKCYYILRILINSSRIIFSP